MALHGAAQQASDRVWREGLRQLGLCADGPNPIEFAFPSSCLDVKKTELTAAKAAIIAGIPNQLERINETILQIVREVNNPDVLRGKLDEIREAIGAVRSEVMEFGGLPARNAGRAEPPVLGDGGRS
jgi:hypothetical protein